MRLTSLSFAHPRVVAHDRARLVDPTIPPSTSGVGEDVFVLSTCLRVELAWMGTPAESDAMLEAIYPNAILPSPEIRVDGDAFLHLSRVAAGLDSPQTGEVEVLGQFRRALSQLSADDSDPVLRHVLEAAVGVARSVRRSLPERVEKSLASAAASAAADRGMVAVLGAGGMARAVVESLGESRVTVFARRPSVVGGVHSTSWDVLAAELASFDAVVSTVPGPVFGDGALDGVEHPLVFVDLGMPPAMTPGDDTEEILYLGVDDLAQRIAGEPLPELEDLASGRARSMWSRLSAPDRAGEVIAAIVRQVDEAVSEEVARFSARLTSSSHNEEVLAQMARTVARRVLHGPISYLGAAADDDRVSVLAEAFGADT